MHTKNLIPQSIWITVITALCMLLCSSCRQKTAPRIIEEMNLVGTAWHGTLSLYNKSSVNVKVGMEFVNDYIFNFSFNEDASEFMKQTTYYYEDEARLYSRTNPMTVNYGKKGLSLECSFIDFSIPETIRIFRNTWVITELTKDSLRLVLSGNNPDRALVLDLKRTW